MRRVLFTIAILLMPSAAFAGCLPGPSMIPCLGANALGALGDAVGSRPGHVCGGGMHAAMDMSGNVSCVPGALSRKAREAAKGPAGYKTKICPMGSVMANDKRGKSFCKDVPGAIHAGGLRTR